MNEGETENCKADIMVEILYYIPNAVLSKIIIKKKRTGNITASSFNAGEKSFAPDTFTQIIIGKAQIEIDKKPISLKPDEGIDMPMHARHQFIANKQFNRLFTIVKNGYEE